MPMTSLDPTSINDRQFLLLVTTRLKKILRDLLNILNGIVPDHNFHTIPKFMLPCENHGIGL